MKKIPTLALLFAVLVVLPACAPEGASQQAAEAPQSAVPALPSLADAAGAQAPLGTAPDFTLATLAGDSLRRSELQGKATLVNFWATWCRPCAEEMPKLQRLHLEHGERGLVVIGVSKDDPHQGLGPVAAYVLHVGVTYPILTGGDRISRAWGGIGKLPTTFLIDGQGTVVRRYVGGAAPALEALIADVEAYLDGRPLGEPYYPATPDPEPGP